MSDIEEKKKIKNILKLIGEINKILDTEPFDKKKYKKKNIELTKLTNIYIQTHGKQKLHNHSLIKQKWDEIKAKGSEKNQKKKKKVFKRTKKTKKSDAGPANKSTLREVSSANASSSAVASESNSNASASRGKAPANRGAASASRGKARANNSTLREVSSANASSTAVMSSTNAFSTAVMSSANASSTAVELTRKGKATVREGKAPVREGKARNDIQIEYESNNLGVRSSKRKGKEPAAIQIEYESNNLGVRSSKRKGKKPANFTTKNIRQFPRGKKKNTTLKNDNGAGPANNNPVINPVSNVGYILLKHTTEIKKKKIKLEELNSKLQALLGECSFTVRDEKDNEDFQRDMEILLSENQLDLFIENSKGLLNMAKVSGKTKIAIIDGENIMHESAFKGTLVLDLITTLVKKDYFVFIFRHNRHMVKLLPRNASEEALLNNFTFQIEVGGIGSFLDDFCSVLLGSLSCSLENYYGKPTFLTNTWKLKSSGLFPKTLSQTSFKRGISGSIGKLNTTDANKLMMINDINIAKVDILPTNFILTLDKFNWCKFNKKKENSNEERPAE